LSFKSLGFPQNLFTLLHVESSTSSFTIVIPQNSTTSCTPVKSFWFLSLERWTTLSWPLQN